jgi:exopolyphosphatase/guanosine-5'-triphosphate,3'-diphosphate pyrophosphatase
MGGIDTMDAEPTGRIGVVDLGSNSGRLVVYDQYGSGYLNIVEDARVPLRLTKELQDDGSLGENALDRTIVALREFHSIAQGAGADRVIVVGTAAMREATNGDAFLQSVQEAAGIDIEILDGSSEALYSFLGAIYGLPVWNGFVLDIGGGSLEITRFRERRYVDSWTLPLGALRTSTEFIKSDPPTGKELRNLKRHIVQTLVDQNLPPADESDMLVGTGGTIRNVAKIDRKQRHSPIQRLHGYVLPFQRVRRIASSLASADVTRRADMPGLNSDRADSIVGGAIAVQVVMDSLGMTELLVSGKGLREGIAFALSGSQPPDPQIVKQVSIAALARRFGSWEVERAEQRVAAVAQLIEMLAADAGPSVRQVAEFAAYLLDIGRSVDYYDRLSHTATIVQVADLDGFTHREIALLTAIIREADRSQSDLKQYEPLLTANDADTVAQCGVILLVADEIERRYPRNTDIKLKIDSRPDSITITIPPFSEYGVAKLEERFQRVFGRELVFH